MILREEIERIIVDVAASQKRFQVSDIAQKLSEPVSRQYINTILKSMTRRELILRGGVGRYTFYALPKNGEYLGKKVKRHLKNENLKEHEVLNDIEKQAPFLENIKENVSSILTYAFSEMLNNAMEHSKSETIDIDVSGDDGNLRFSIRDRGIGAFRSIKNKHHLKSELEAIQELLKGKTTTAPQFHSGEGIFFTSKIADLFTMDSYGLRLRVDNNIGDVFVEELSKEVKGTLVEFTIKLTTRKHLNDIFVKYSTNPEEHAFDKTEIKVKLYTMGTVYVSRSQARRVMTGLSSKFKSIVLDFDKVPTVGQAFSDEIFRVYKIKHPDIKVEAVNMNEAVRFMVERVGSE